MSDFGRGRRNFNFNDTPHSGIVKGQRNRSVRKHLLDRSKGSLTASVGTACGIMLRESILPGLPGMKPITLYFAQGPGTMEYEHPRVVLEDRHRDRVTCKRCLQSYKARFK